jgi:hypothetical protein
LFIRGSNTREVGVIGDFVPSACPFCSTFLIASGVPIPPEVEKGEKLPRFRVFRRKKAKMSRGVSVVPA